MPVRTIPKNYRNLTGLVPNTRTSGMTAFESTLERDFLFVQRHPAADQLESEAAVVPVLAIQAPPGPRGGPLLRQYS